MAVPDITGNGTSESPYVPHDYNQLMTVFGYVRSNSSNLYPTYVKLPDSTSEDGYIIDCKDYEWSSVGVANMEFDLNGGCIKNINIPVNNVMFTNNWSGTSYSKSVNIFSSKPKGRILNIFGKEASSLFSTGYVNLTNISMSINASGFSSNLIPGGTHSKCSFYIEDTRETSRYIFSNSSKLYMCDIKVMFYNSSLMKIYQGTSGGIIQNCRFRGKVGSNYTSTNDSLINSGTSNYKTISLYSCIFDIENPSGTDAAFIVNNSMTQYSTCVLNTTKWHYSAVHSSTYNLKLATDTQIKDSEWLNNNGFPVVKKASESGE